jgi:hypothetical protein
MSEIKMDTKDTKTDLQLIQLKKERHQQDSILEFNTIRLLNNIVPKWLGINISRKNSTVELNNIRSWSEIKSDTFESDIFIKNIATVCNKSENYVQNYFQDKNFQLECLTGIYYPGDSIKAELYAKILMGDQIIIENCMDHYVIILAIVNNYDFNKKLAIKNINIVAKHNPKLYLELVADLNPKEKSLINIKTLEAAVEGSLNTKKLQDYLPIIQSLLEVYVPTENIIEKALHEGNHEISKILIDAYVLSTRTQIKNVHLLNYPLLNSDWDLFEYMLNRDWIITINCVYSAILSGNVEILDKIVTKFSKDLHTIKLLDTVTYTGPKILLANDILYTLPDGSKYAAHCMNYAVQSKSLQMVQKIYDLEYGISLSNLTTAISQSSCEILEFLCAKLNYPKLPFYFWYYFSHKTYCQDKLLKAKILIDNNMLSFEKITGNMDDYRIANAHLKMLEDKQHIIDLQILNDVDFYFQPNIVFKESGNKIDILLLTQIKLGLHLDLIPKVKNLILQTKSKIRSATKQLIIDAVCYYGSHKQIEQLDLKTIFIPSEYFAVSENCAEELIANYSISKLVYLIKNNYITVTTQIKDLITILSDDILNKIFL